MAFKAFTKTCVYENKHQKEKDKFSIHCLECFDRNVYVGTACATVQHLIVLGDTHGDQSPGRSKIRDGRARKLGSSKPVVRLRAVPLFNHLLVLWDRGVTALNMFSLEPVPNLKKIQHVSLFEVSDSPLTAPEGEMVEMVTSSSRRKAIHIHVVGVDRWEVVKEVPLHQDPVAMAIDGTSLCVATCDRYLLCDLKTGSSELLFPHNHNTRHVFVTSVGRGEFLLNGPESLGEIFFALGSLYLSHGKLTDAIETWVKIADGSLEDPSCSDAYGHIVRTLSQLEDRDAVWKFADWTLQRNQETGVQIFTKCPAQRQETQEVLVLLEKFPLALVLYLEFLVHDLNSEEERHHDLLASAYVTQALQEEEEADLKPTRRKLQQLLWESKFYDIAAVYERVKSTHLYTEKAVLHGRRGEHSQALQLLVHQGRDPQAAEAYCCRAAQGQDATSSQALMLTLLQIYLASADLSRNAIDLLNNNPQVFAAEKVVQFLPDAWSVRLVHQFLVRSVRATLHQGRMVKLQKALARAELLRHKVTWMQASKTSFILEKGQKCKVCHRLLAESQFACDLRGGTMHTSCTGPFLPS